MAVNDRIDDLADSLEDHFADCDTVRKYEQNEVYFELTNDTDRPTLVGMDDACVIASDRGFVPRGIIDSGGVRFQLRTDVDV